MSYEVEFLPEAQADLEGLDATIRSRILAKTKWLSENLESISPEPLSGAFKGYFKLRVGDHRIVYTVSRDANTILVRLVGHRRDIYR